MRQKFDARALALDTPISTSASQKPHPLQEYFPSVNDAFVAPPKLLAEEAAQNWFYCDLQGTIQGPFPSSQMRSWFQMGFFNANTRVKLADKPTFTQLGLLFPEGAGAFLSAGNESAYNHGQAPMFAGTSNFPGAT